MNAQRSVMARRAAGGMLAVLLAVGMPAVALEAANETATQSTARTAKVAGAFYPAEPDELRQTVTSLLSRYAAPEATATKPRILILPHAGYAYSGPVAARGFRELTGRTYDGVVVVAFTHRAWFQGASVDDRDAYQTPLGTIPVDAEAVAFLKSQPGLTHVEDAHESNEHSLEVMLPFLQVSLGRFRLVPILMGGVERTEADALAQALTTLSKRGDYLFVFSTDLSHYHPHDEAKQRDEATVNAILFETPEAVDRLFASGQLEACGRGPILTSLLFARRLGYPERRLLLYADSGDTAGDKSRVVGYAAIGMYQTAAGRSEGLISDQAGQVLVQAARAAIVGSLKPAEARPVALDAYPELAQPRGLFVTLRRKDGQLRGCIGRIESDVALGKLLPTIALEAAQHDPRFSPLAADELDQITLEVSVLTPPRVVGDVKEIVAGRDGVVLRKGDRSGVFLPQVWDETGWTRLEFLRELAQQKAGLAADAWQDAQLSTFQDQAFEEEPPALGAITPH